MQTNPTPHLKKVPENLIISPATDENLPEILRMAFSHLDPVEMHQRIIAIRAIKANGGLPLEGVLGGWRAGRLCGAAFSQYRSDGTVILWPPRTVDEEPPETVRELFNGIAKHAENIKARIMLMFVEQTQELETGMFRDCEMRFLSELAYLIAKEEDFPKSRLSGRLEFVPIFQREAAEHETPMPPENLPAGIFAEYAGLIEATYERTKDFPELSGVCPAGEVLRGYQEDNIFRPEIWFKIRKDGREIGALILGDHERDRYLELTYMGLIPEARGRGFAREVVEFALGTARDLGRQFVLVSVDVRNDSAYHAYINRGFRPWDRKSLYLRRFEDFIQ